MAFTTVKGPNDTGITQQILPYDDMDWDDKIGFNADDAATAEISGAAFDAGIISWLCRLTNYQFAVPSGATIDGIQVTIDKTSTVQRCEDACVQLCDVTGSLIGTNKAYGSVAWPITTYAVSTYGSAGDKWGITPTVAMVNSASFGLGLAVKATGANANAYVDYAFMQIWYTTPELPSTLQNIAIKRSLLGVGL